MKLRCTRGFGAIEGPDGETIDVEDDFAVDEDAAEYLLNNYPGMEVVSTEPETEADTDGSEGDTEVCGADMSDGSTCERLADECPYH